MKTRAMVINWKDPDQVNRDGVHVSDGGGHIVSIIPDNSEGKRTVGLENGGE